jgi:hypothetical protein
MRPAQEIEVVLVARPGAKRSLRWDGGAPTNNGHVFGAVASR